MTRPSPRASDPAAFSAGEAIAGGALTLAAYLVVSFFWYWLVTVLSMSGAIGNDALGGGWVWAYFVWIYGAMTALPAAIVGTVTASLIGRAMRHRASFPLHLVVHAAHAYVIGALATVVCLLVMQAEPGVGGFLFYPLLWGGPATAIAALIGWRSIVAIARHRDAKRLAVANA
ncbi:MAG TPA: hypothetical protein VNQ52_07965 [Microbacteriaceae bacterium]|nr:hypothetical protein [Microbacteriaceae bacterium]